MQNPSVGRVVHYVQYDGDRCCAAMVTGVEPDGKLGLHVMPPGGGCHDQDEVPHSERVMHGTWHWPERVE